MYILKAIFLPLPLYIISLSGGGQINGLKNSEDHDYQSLKNGQGGQIKVVRKGGQKRWSETRRGDEKSDCGSYATEP